MWSRPTVYLPQPQEPQTSASSSDRTQSQVLTGSLCASRAWVKRCMLTQTRLSWKQGTRPRFSTTDLAKEMSPETSQLWEQQLLLRLMTLNNNQCLMSLKSVFVSKFESQLISVRRCISCSDLTIRPHMASLPRRMTPGTMTPGTMTRHNPAINYHQPHKI